MNPLIITVIGSTAAFIISLFAANYLNQRFIERILDQHAKTTDAKLDALRAEFKSDFSVLRGDIASLRSEIATLNARISGLEQRIERIERQLDKIFKPAIPGI